MSDPVERWAVIELLSDRRCNTNCFDESGKKAYEELSKAIENVKDLPSAQPERKRGKWVDGWSSGFDGTRHWFRECSVCGYGRDDDDPEKDTNFCPNCGADMRGEQKCQM